MAGPILAIILALLGWRVARVIAHRAARRRRTPPVSTPRASTSDPAIPVVPNVTTSSVPVSTVSAPEPIARAFPVYGLGASRDAALALERMLRHLTGVTAVYVSPRTALAYLDFFPAQVTEEQLAQSIRGGGYQVGDASHRFDWRHVPQKT